MRYGNVELHNVCEIIEGDGEPGFGMSRLPRDVREKINPGARGMSMMGAGCEIRGMLAEGGQARVVLRAVDSNVTPPVATVYHGCFCGQSILVENEPTEILISAPPGLAAMSRISSAGVSAVTSTASADPIMKPSALLATLKFFSALTSRCRASATAVAARSVSE